MNLQWNIDLAVGHQLIDEQHRELFDQFDAFLAACDERQGAEQLRTLFGYLDSYVVHHFREEEALMERYGYPELDCHRKEHRIFIGKLEALKEALASAGPTIEVLLRTNKTLLYWLTGHIREVDTRLGEYLRGQNPQTQNG